MSKELFRLMKLDRKELIEMFSSLDAPDMQEMDGEFKATILDQGKWLHNFATILAFNFPGAWLSKSFSPISGTQGQGYNSYRAGRVIRNIFRMKTSVGASDFDGRSSYHLDYVSVENQERLPAWTRLRSELRKLSDRLYLGLGTADFGISRFTRQQPFLLEGPVGEYDESVWAAQASTVDSNPTVQPVAPTLVPQSLLAPHASVEIPLPAGSTVAG